MGSFDGLRTPEADVEAYVNAFVTGKQAPAREGVRLRDTPEAVTGLVMTINAAALAAVIEAPMPVLRALVRQLTEHADAGTCPLQRAKVCAISEEVPREFVVWGRRVLRVPADDLPAGTVNPVKLAFDLYRAALELARGCAAMADDKALDFLERVHPRQLPAMPTVEKVAALQAADDVCTPAEWMAIFETPLNLALESETVWPVEPWLKY